MVNTSTVIVVEGNTDKSLISTFVSGEIVITNGTYVSRETIKYVRRLSLTRKILLIVDPDGPGRKIKQIFSDNDIDFISVNLDKKQCIGNNKVGVAQANINYLRQTILPLLDLDIPTQSDVTLSTLIDLGFNSNKKKDILQVLKEKYDIYSHSTSQTLNQIKQLNITEKELRETLNEKI